MRKWEITYRVKNANDLDKNITMTREFKDYGDMRNNVNIEGYWTIDYTEVD